MTQENKNNALITEDYVSFEVAKLLKEKGFDESISMVYMSHGNLCKCTRYDSICNSNYNDITKNYFECTAPTHQMAAKWLREEHNLSIDNTCSIRGFYCSIVHIVKDKSGRIIDVEDSADWETPYCKTLEEAFDKALKFCLENLI